MFLVAALYKFSIVDNRSVVQSDFKKQLKNLSIHGTILIGKEGLNGTISGSKHSIERAISFIKKLPNFHDLDVKYSQSKINPFIRLKIKLKDEIVTIGDKSINPNKEVGKYVNPEEWNDLISNKNTIVIDTRNNYEHSIGTFKNSLNPNTIKFREFPEWVRKQKFSDHEKQNRKFAMFCTGGIRCEKASSFMLKEGFKDVSHLKGGILNYFDSVPKNESKWKGECFVFDERVSVKHDLTEGSYDMCHGCRMPITNEDKETDEYIKGVACPSCFFEKTEEQKARYMSRQKQVDLAKERNQKHIGPKDKKLKK